MLALLIACSVVAAIKDVRLRSIPNWCCAAIALLGLGFQIWRVCDSPFSLGELSLRISSHLPHPYFCLVGAVLVSLVLFVFELVCRGISRSVFGFGDLKFAAGWLLVVGPAGLISFVLGTFAGALVAKARGKSDFACAPWLCAAYLIHICVLIV